MCSLLYNLQAAAARDARGQARKHIASAAKLPTSPLSMDKHNLPKATTTKTYTSMIAVISSYHRYKACKTLGVSTDEKVPQSNDTPFCTLKDPQPHSGAPLTPTLRVQRTPIWSM